MLRLLYDRLVVNGRTVIGQCLFVPIFLTFALTLERNLSSIVGEAGLIVCALAAILFGLTTKPTAGSPRGRRITLRWVLAGTHRHVARSYPKQLRG